MSRVKKQMGYMQAKGWDKNPQKWHKQYSSNKKRKTFSDDYINLICKHTSLWHKSSKLTTPYNFHVYSKHIHQTIMHISCIYTASHL